MKEIYTAYAPFDDITFIMEETYNDNCELASLECIGWYCGEPNEENTETFAHSLKANYEG